MLPDHCVCADDELGPGVPLMVGDVVVSLQPDPLLTFGQEAVVAGLPFTVLHYCRGGATVRGRSHSQGEEPQSGGGHREAT